MMDCKYFNGSYYKKKIVEPGKSIDIFNIKDFTYGGSTTETGAE